MSIAVIGGSNSLVNVAGKNIPSDPQPPAAKAESTALQVPPGAPVKFVSEVEKIVLNIRQLQLEGRQSQLQMNRCAIGIGNKLSLLKRAVPHGDWLKYLGELGYDDRAAQKLMKLANSRVAKQMRAEGPDSVEYLPGDIQKLDALASLSELQLSNFLETHGPRIPEMNRKQLRDEVNKFLGKPSESPAPNPDEKKPDEKKPDEKKPDEKKPHEKKPHEVVTAPVAPLAATELQISEPLPSSELPAPSVPPKPVLQPSHVPAAPAPPPPSSPPSPTAPATNRDKMEAAKQGLEGLKLVKLALDTCAIYKTFLEHYSRIEAILKRYASGRAFEEFVLKAKTVKPAAVPVTVPVTVTDAGTLDAAGGGSVISDPTKAVATAPASAAVPKPSKAPDAAEAMNGAASTALGTKDTAKNASSKSGKEVGKWES